MMLLQSFHNVIANDKPRWKLCTKHILFKLRQNYTLCQIFLISWSSFNSSFLTCESQAVVLKKNGKLVMYYYVQCIHIVNFSSKRAPILCKHPYILTGLELARVPRVPGTRWNSEHHLRHPRILRFLILTGTRRAHSL